MLMRYCEAERVIHQLCGTSFDSHQFILFLIMTNPHLYFNLLERYRYDVAITDMQIGLFLEKNQERLRIKKTGTTNSRNIKSGITPCASWEKTN